MEENQIVQTLSILLYSRSYQKLYIEIYHLQTHDLVSKLYINTYQHRQIPLNYALKKLQIVIKKNQQNVQILNGFKFNVQDFSLNSKIQQMNNYVKVKKRFDQYSLLFQIFYRLRSTFNSTWDLGKQKIRESQQQRKKQKQKYIKDIAKSNVYLLSYKVLNKYHNNGINKVSLPSQQSLNQNQMKIKRKTKKTNTLNVRLYKLRKEEQMRNSANNKDDRNNNRVKSQKRFNNLKSQSNLTFINNKNNSKVSNINNTTIIQSIGSNKNQSITNNQTLTNNESLNNQVNLINQFQVKPKPQTFLLRKQKKNLSYQQRKKKLNLGFNKKITFLDQKQSLDAQSDDFVTQDLNVSKINSIIRQQTQQTAQDLSLFKIPKQIQKINKKVSYQQQQIMKKQIDQKNIDDLFRQQQFNSQNIYQNLRQLCQQRQSQKVLFRTKRNFSSMKKNNISTNGSNFYMRNQFINTEGSYQKNIINFKNNKSLSLLKNNSINKLSSSLSKYSALKNGYSQCRQQYKQNLIQNTIKSIQRQNKILNYVKNHCQTLQFISPNKNKLNQINNQETKQNKTNKQRIQLSQQMKLLKLKKKKAQQQYLKKIRNCTNNKKSIRS